MIEAGDLTTYKPKVIVFSYTEELDQFATSRFVEQMTAKPHSVLTLPTGSTPKGMYDLLVKLRRAQDADFNGLTIYNLDEYWPIKRDHPSSYTQYMRENFINHVNVRNDRWHIPNGEARDANDEAAYYEDLLCQSGRVDLAIIGIGPGTTCHIGFNERGSSIESRTRYMPLDEQTRQVNSRFFRDPNEIPSGTITQGVANILEAKSILLLAKGESKAWGINQTLNGPIGPEFPSSYLRYHPDVTVAIDQAAAGLLSR
ncbi:glucosamine-6-phosphate deaminase [Candidatus Daviesbacteria bacterium]|nr:glucosamine-6-phosphate deaminase [Candidatus Daviesbacteria bacterium]